MHFAGILAGINAMVALQQWLLFVLLIHRHACSTSSTLAYTVDRTSDPATGFHAAAATLPRRDLFVASAVAIAGCAGGWVGPLSSRDAAWAAAIGNNPKFTTFSDSAHKFSIQVPDGWILSEQSLQDRRKLLLWTDPNDRGTSLFVVYTPVRDDFTSLGSFGTVDQVATQVILPKGRIMDQDSGIESKMLSAMSQKQAYFFDYTQSVPGTQPPTHYRVIFSLQQGATGGAGGILVTITAQTPESVYPQNKALFDHIVDSYARV